jgi:hypothetical protein
VDHRIQTGSFGNKLDNNTVYTNLYDFDRHQSRKNSLIKHKYGKKHYSKDNLKSQLENNKTYEIAANTNYKNRINDPLLT